MAKADSNKVLSRPIIIKHFCKLPLIFRLLLVIGLFFISILAYFGIAEKNGNVITIVAVLLSFFFAGFGFYINYGVKITSKRVYIIYQNAFRIFNFDDIVSMEISFDNDSIYGRIKAKDQKPYYFCFDDFVLSSRIFGFERFLTVKVSLSDKYINQKKKELLKCNKIRVK